MPSSKDNPNRRMESTRTIFDDNTMNFTLLKNPGLSKFKQGVNDQD